MTLIYAFFLVITTESDKPSLEKGIVGKGTTGSSTGNLYAPVDERLYKVAAMHDESALQAVVSSRTEAVDFIEQLVQELGIDCAFGRVPWYLGGSELQAG